VGCAQKAVRLKVNLSIREGKRVNRKLQSQLSIGFEIENNRKTMLTLEFSRLSGAGLKKIATKR
jgi:hypothetical protein